MQGREAGFFFSPLLFLKLCFCLIRPITPTGQRESEVLWVPAVQTKEVEGWWWAGGAEDEEGEPRSAWRLPARAGAVWEAVSRRGRPHGEQTVQGWSASCGLRGFSLHPLSCQTPRRQSRLFCRYYDNGRHPRFVIDPLKQEDEWDSPHIVRYHDVVSDSDMEKVKDLAKPRVRLHLLIYTILSVRPPKGVQPVSATLALLLVR